MKPLDEAVWQAWLAKGRAQDRRRHAAFMKGVKWVSIAALLAAAGHWPHPVPYDVVVRFVVAAGAMAMMFQALRSRYYVVAAVFGALVLLYNPVAPVFGFSGGMAERRAWWQAPSRSSRRSPGAMQGWNRMTKFAETLC